MNVGTADLKNQLSKYLRLIRETGETVIVMDRDEPVAVLSALDRGDDAEWSRYRSEALARAKKLGLKLEVPVKRPRRVTVPLGRPAVAPDGRTDIKTVDLVRKGREY